MEILAKAIFIHIPGLFFLVLIAGLAFAILGAVIALVILLNKK